MAEKIKIEGSREMGRARKFDEDTTMSIAEDYAAGESCHGIAHRYGCSVATVLKCISDMRGEVRDEDNPRKVIENSNNGPGKAA